MIAQTTPSPEPLKLLRLRDVADRLSVSLSTLRREIRGRRLKAVRIGRVLRINEAELAAYIAARAKR
jgi:excisionase family DNA binding protein